MNDKAWVLKGVDAESRERAAAEAERRGVSLADYLTDVVLQRALTEQMLTEEAEGPPAAAALPAAPENFAVRHRLEAIERRVHLSVGGLDSAIRALDSSVFGVAGRIDEAEVLAADTADALDAAMLQTNANLAAMRRRLSDVEEQGGALAEAQDAACQGFADRYTVIEEHIGVIEDGVRAANTSAAQLAVAYDALKHAVAEDFSTLAQETAERLSFGLDEVRAAADDTAAQADAAVAHLIAELRSVRETVEARLYEGQAETRLRMQTAFADAAERVTALAERVAENERVTARSAEQLRAQLADVEDGAQTALEETAESLRQAGATLAGEFARATRDTRTAIDSVHGDLSAEIAELRERHASAVARLKLVDAAAASACSEIAAVREGAESRAIRTDTALRGALAQAQTDWESRFDEIAVRLAGDERDAAETHFTLRAETERVESCVFAALEKLGRDRSDGDAALERQIADTREQNNGTMARLSLLEAGAAPLGERLTRIETELSAQDGVQGRVARLEAIVESEESAHAALRGHIGALAAQLDTQQAEGVDATRLEQLRERIAAHEVSAGEAAEKLNAVARMVARVTTQGVEAAAQSERRVSELETALWRLQGEINEDEPTASLGLVAEIQQRIAELDARQAQSFETLRAGMAHFIAENGRRLEALEQPSLAESYDVAGEFDTLRRRIDDRILGIEQRSVRALEQVADTMAMLEKRFGVSASLPARSA